MQFLSIVFDEHPFLLNISSVQKNGPRKEFIPAALVGGLKNSKSLKYHPNLTTKRPIRKTPQSTAKNNSNNPQNEQSQPLPYLEDIDIFATFPTQLLQPVAPSGLSQPLAPSPIYQPQPLPNPYKNNPQKPISTPIQLSQPVAPSPIYPQAPNPFNNNPQKPISTPIQISQPLAPYQPLPNLQYDIPVPNNNPDEEKTTTASESQELSLQSTDKLFFDNIKAGRLPAIKRLLDEKINVNITCTKRYRSMPNTEGWTALHFAAWENNAALVKMLLSYKAEINFTNPAGQTPLHVAAYRNSAEVVQLLIDNKCNLHAEIKKRYGQTALHLACLRGHIEVSTILIKHGLNLDMSNDNPRGPQSPFQLAILSGNNLLIEYLLKNHSPSFDYENSYNPIDVAAISGHLIITETLLTWKKKHNSSLSLDRGFERAVIAGNVDMVSTLLHHLQASQTSSLIGYTLPKAVKNNQLQIITIFLEDSSVDSSYYTNAVLTACKEGKDDMVDLFIKSGKIKLTDINNMAIFNTVNAGHSQVLKTLISNGLDPNITNEVGSTPLHIAAASDYYECVDILVKQVNLDTIDNAGQTALFLTANAGNYACAKSLINAGASVDIRNPKRQGITPLHAAASRGKNLIVKLLVSANADINATKSIPQGPQTPLAMARQNSFKQTEQLLIELGAIDTEKHGQDHHSNISTEVRLLRFIDTPPKHLQYPKDVVSLSEKSLSHHDYSDLIKNQNNDYIGSPTNTSKTRGGGLWKTVRLFISSTFTDMQAERNYLVKYIIPTLRKKCLSKQIHLVEVDLRWGVTEQEATSGKTVEICLSEVENCMIFTALLGEKYGWVPDPSQIRDDLRVHHEWINGHSITAMEITRGALKKKNDPKCYASFYFRDESVVASIPQKLKSQFKDDNTTKLNELKSAIRETHFPVCEYKPVYKGLNNDGVVEFNQLEKFGENFIENVWNAINTEFPDDAQALSELEEEKFYHDQFQAHRITNFVGRKDKLKEIKKLIDSNVIKQPIVIVGQPGSGKSALTGYLSHTLKESGSYTVISHFIGASPASTDIILSLRRICKEIVQEYGLWDIVSDDLDYKQLQALFVKILAGAAQSVGMKKLVLIIDALNQLHNDKNKALLLEWLPTSLPSSGVKVVVTCLGGECQDILISRGHPIVEIGELSPNDREDIVSLTLARHHKKLDSKQMKEFMKKQDVTKPLYLIVCCEELRVYGIYEKLEKKINEIAPTLPGLLEQVLLRLEQEHTQKMIADVMSTLYCSRHGLIELEITQSLNLNSSVWGSLYLSLGLLLRPMGREGQLDFFHRQIAKAVGRRYVPDQNSSMAYHKILVNYYLSKCDTKLNYTFDVEMDPTKKFMEPEPRAVTELVYHLIQARMWKELESTLCNLSFINRRALNHQIYNLLADFNALDDYLMKYNDVVIPPKTVIRIKEYKRFIQTHAPQLVQHPQGAFQLALNQSLSVTVAEDATKYLSANKKNSYIEWLNRPEPGDSGFLLMIQATMDVNDCQFSPDQKVIISGQKDGSVSLWNAITGEEIIKLLNHKARVNQTIFSKDGRFFITCASDGLVNIYNSSTKQLLHQINHTDAANSADFSPDGKLIAVGLENGLIQIYNSSDYKIINTLKQHSAGVLCLAFSPDNKYLLSGSTDKSLIIWDIKSGQSKCQLIGHTKPIKSCKYNKSGKWILSASQDKLLKIWDAATGSLLQDLVGHHDNVASCAFSNNEKYIITGSWDRTAKLWKNGSSNEKPAFYQVGPFPGATHFVNTVAFSPDDQLVLVGYPDHTIKLFSIDSVGTRTTKAPPKTCKVHSKIIRGIHYSPSSQTIVTGSWDKTIKIHSLNVPPPASRVADMQYIRNTGVISGHTKRVNEVVVFDDMICSTSMDTTCKLWHLKSKEEIVTFRGHNLNVFTIAVSHDRRYIVTGSSDMSIRLWNVQTGEQVGILTGHEDWVTAVTFSPYSRRIVSGSRDGIVKVWDSETGDLIETLQYHKKCVMQIRYTTNGKYFLTASEDHTLKLFDAFTLKLIMNYSGHTDEITACSWLSGDEYFVSGSSDRSVRLWHKDRPEQIWAYFCEGGVLAITVTENHHILAGDSAGSLYVLEMNNLMNK